MTMGKEPLIYMKVLYCNLKTTMFSRKIYDEPKLLTKEFDRLTDFLKWLTNINEISIHHIGLGAISKESEVNKNEKK